MNLEAEKRYLLRLDYFENRGRAVAKLLWSSPSTPQQVIPQSQLYSRVTDLDQDDLPDVWELANGFNPNDPSDGKEAPDGKKSANRKKFEDGFEAENARVQVAGLAEQWFSQDVGQVGPAGSALVANGVWKLTGSGADIWANADSFQYAYQTLRGDGQIVGRVVSQDNSDPWAKAGVMIRETLDPSSRHAMLAVTPEQGVVFLHRDEKERSTAQELAGPRPGPVWLKLVRRGAVVTSFTSADGVKWEWVGTRKLDFPDELFVGLVVSSHDNSRLASATFDQVSLETIRPTEPADVVVGSGDGLAASYFDGTSGNVVTRIDPSVDFDWDIDSPVEGIGSDHFSVRWEGYCEPVSDELYALKVVSDDGARLWLDGQLVIDAWSDRGASADHVKMNLKAGRKYPIKLEYYERTLEAVVRLLWSTPHLAEQVIPQSQLYSKIAFVVANEEKDPEQTGASTRGKAVASSAGSFVTAEAAREPGTANADAAQLDGLGGFTNIDEVPGAAAVARLGQWEIEGTAIYAVDRRGYLEYEIRVPTANLYRLEIEGVTHNLLDVDPAFYLVVSIHGESLGRRVLDAGPDRNGQVHLFTPWLAAGIHRLRIYWDNARKGRSLQINAVRLQAIQASDSDGNGVTDWVEEKLDTENGIEVAGPGSRSDLASSSLAGKLKAAATSLTSPACVEGRGGFLSMMKITANGEVIAPRQGVAERWFANAPLSQSGPTTVDVSFQNGGVRRSATIQWEPTDLLTSGNLTIRQGDALLFQVGEALHPADDAAKIRIEVGGEVRYDGESARVPHAFDQAGTFTVTASHEESNGASVKRSITVKVVGGTFEEQAVAWTKRERLWDCPQVPAEAVLDFDQRMQFTQDAVLAESGRRFRVTMDAGEDRTVLARLGQAGPVLARATLRGIDIYGVSESSAFYGQEYEDGSRLVETAVVQSRVFPDVRVQLNIIVAGVMFEDGTLVKSLRAEDFDPTGLVTIRFIMPPGVQTSNCHVMRAYQNQLLLGEY